MQPFPREHPWLETLFFTILGALFGFLAVVMFLAGFGQWYIVVYFPLAVVFGAFAAASLHLAFLAVAEALTRE